MSHTVQQIIDLITESTTIAPPQDTVDTLKAGRPETVVTGIGTTFMPHMGVLQQAVSQGINLVIPHEPLFYEHRDDSEHLEGDEVYLAKRRFIEEHNLAVWRFHDLPHRMKPDLIVEGMIETFGWDAYRASDDLPIFRLPVTTVGNLASQIKRSTGGSVVRIVGDPELKCSKAVMCVGAPGSRRQIHAVRLTSPDVLVTGEAAEWETVEYIRDAIAQGRKIAMILVGHRNSEEGGMVHVTNWLKGFITDIPITHLDAGDPLIAVK